MAVCIGLLRAVNLGSHGKVSMEALRDFVAGLGFGDVQTLMNSGNVVFSTNQAIDAEFEDQLEREAALRLDLRTDFLLRDEEEWVRMIDGNPFTNEAERDPSHLLVIFLKSAPAAAAVESLQAAVTGPEIIRAGERHLYITYPAGIGTSKLTNAVIEGKLGIRGTGRNWNTVLRLHEVAREIDGPT